MTIIYFLVLSADRTEKREEPVLKNIFSLYRFFILTTQIFFFKYSYTIEIEESQDFEDVNQNFIDGFFYSFCTKSNQPIYLEVTTLCDDTTLYVLKKPN